LRDVYGVDSLNALDFNDDSIAYDKVRTVFSYQASLVKHGNTDLAAIPDSGSVEFNAQCFLVRGLVKTRTEVAVNLDRAADDLFRQRIVFVHGVPRCLGASVFRLSEGH
jgi:hypothetical protein